jgi:hypothetical protein
MKSDSQRPLERADELYESYGVPLEPDHWGEFLAISEDGRFVVAQSLLDLADRSVEELGPGAFAYRIGERAVGRLR